MKQLNRIKVVLDLETLLSIAEVQNVDVRELLHVEKKNKSINLQ